MVDLFKQFVTHLEIYQCALSGEAEIYSNVEKKQVCRYLNFHVDRLNYK